MLLIFRVLHVRLEPNRPLPAGAREAAGGETARGARAWCLECRPVARSAAGGSGAHSECRRSVCCLPVCAGPPERPGDAKSTMAAPLRGVVTVWRPTKRLVIGGQTCGYGRLWAQQRRAVASSAAATRTIQERYDNMVASGELQLDPKQQAAVERLGDIEALVDAELASPFVRAADPAADADSGSGGGWGWFGAKPAKPPEPPDPLEGLGVRGLYLWGGVGCGKTMLMDMFFESAPENMPKRRVHFHAFMLEVHQRVHDTVLRRSGAALADRNVVKGVAGAAARGLGGVTPEQAGAAMSFYHQRTKIKNEQTKRAQDNAEDDVVTVAREIAAESRLLCFDELQITDIADAMVMRRMLGELFASGCILVTTSNRPPEDLYKGGLNRQSFLPAIELLQRACIVQSMNDPVAGDSTDYRRMTSASDVKMFHEPLSDGTAREMDAAFMALSGGHSEEGNPVERDKVVDVMMGRNLTVSAARDGVAKMEFVELCGMPVGAADYMALAENFHTLLLTGVPQFTRATMNELRRFITLVDLLYERNCRLVCSAEVPLAEIFDKMGLDEIAAAAEKAQEQRNKEEAEAAMRVAGEGGSSGRSTTMFQSDGVEAEWSATGMPGVSLAEQGRGSKHAADSFGHADNVFASERTMSRLCEMGSVEYLDDQRQRWGDMKRGGIHHVRR